MNAIIDQKNKEIEGHIQDKIELNAIIDQLRQDIKDEQVKTAAEIKLKDQCLADYDEQEERHDTYILT